jgi:hypothetical protein
MIDKGVARESGGGREEELELLHLSVNSVGLQDRLAPAVV